MHQYFPLNTVLVVDTNKPVIPDRSVHHCKAGLSELLPCPQSAAYSCTNGCVRVSWSGVSDFEGNINSVTINDNCNNDGRMDNLNDPMTTR